MTQLHQNMNLRPAQLDDLPTLLDFEQRVIAAERPFNSVIVNQGGHFYDLPGLIDDPDSMLMVVETDAILGCGYVSIRQSKPAWQHLRHAYLGFMFTLESHRGQGINQCLMDALMRWSQQRGVVDFYLDVYADNASAIRAYEKCGFKTSMISMKRHL